MKNFCDSACGRNRFATEALKTRKNTNHVSVILCLCGKQKFPKGIKNKSMAIIPSQTWHKIADNISEINFNANGLAEIDINGKTICLAKHSDQLFACTQKCPHAGGLLADGHLDALGNLVCPLHKYKFNLKNGRNISGEGYHLKTFSIETRVDGIFVNMANPAFSP
jgi:nitrite reductase/ring-hydroxylating ferredoxin subunit